MKREIFRFLVAGGVTFILELLVLYILADYVGVYYLTASAVAFTVAVSLNYVLCQCWVFKGQKQADMRTIVIFILVSVAGLGINQFCMWSLVTFLQLYYLVAKIFSTAVVTLWNYFMKRWALVK